MDYNNTLNTIKSRKLEYILKLIDSQYDMVRNKFISNSKVGNHRAFSEVLYKTTGFNSELFFELEQAILVELDEKKKKFLDSKQFINDSSDYDDFLNESWLIKVNYERKIKVIQLLENQENLFLKWRKNNKNQYPHGSFILSHIDFQNSIFKYIDFIVENRLAFGEIDFNYAKYVQAKTILETDKILLDLKANAYDIVEVLRSTNPNLSIGTYFYSLNNNEFRLISPPYNTHEFSNKAKYLIFDSQLYLKTINEIITIETDSIKNYELYGTELMKSTVETSNKNKQNENEMISNSENKIIKSPKIMGTILSEMIFGASYTVLKGASSMMQNIADKMNKTNESLEIINNNLTNIAEAINNISISTTHEVFDTRVVQVVLSDETDIVLKGISIYYDLNRILKNKVESNKVQSTKNDYIQELKMIKELLDMGILTEEEFNSKKKELLITKTSN